MQDKENFQAYCGYHQVWEGTPDKTLVHTDSGTPCGELLRRYWQPVALTSDLEDRPRLIKVLGEELVLFRDKSGSYGLVHKKCPHRRASLEYGHCEDHGIRCCYHGWVFDVDGTILDIPGEPADSEHARHARQVMRLGAYPVKEFKGLLFAYLGPPEHLPEFPIYDSYDIAGMTMSPYQVKFNCNWIQVLDAIVDPVHTAFLHQQQFSDGFGELGAIRFYERDKLRYLGTASRRVGDNIWVRVNELILPNFTQAGAAFACDGTEVRYFGRSAFTRWVVPLDDETCVAYAWGNFGERGDPYEFNNQEGMERIEQGEIVDRPYAQRQRNPGDVEAVEGMGVISDHEREYLVPGDKGVVAYRRQLRRLCTALQKGKQPPQPSNLGNGIVNTLGSDTVLKVPVAEDDAAQQQKTGDQVMDILFAADSLTGVSRDESIIEQLKKLN
ncbi:MAG: nitrite reductase/ring-hydroxylating ferredoxin subunit [Gammaproteobacteria bacterium]|jgi:nitrite reductase/ring-hydroxylating ferredoxin subunit